MTSSRLINPSVWNLEREGGLTCEAYLCSRVSMVVGVHFMFLHLVGVPLPDRLLRKLLADAGIYLAHLRALPHGVAFIFQMLRRLDGAKPG